MHEVRRMPLPDPSGDHLTDNGTLEPGLLDGLLTDVLPQTPAPLDAVAQAVQAHREHARAWYGDLIGPLAVPASSVVPFVEALRPSDHALRILLLGLWEDSSEERMRAARAQLLDDDRIELTGVELSMPEAAAPAEMAEAALAELDVSAPSWLRIPADPDWIEALDVIADDGAERVALVLPSPEDDDADRSLASMIQALASRGVTFSLADAPGATGIDLVTTATSFGLLNLLVVVGAAAQAAATTDSSSIVDNAASLDHLAGLAGETDAEVVIGEALRIGPQSTAAIRTLLDRIACASVRALVLDLEAAGLIVPDVA